MNVRSAIICCRCDAAWSLDRAGRDRGRPHRRRLHRSSRSRQLAGLRQRQRRARRLQGAARRAVRQTGSARAQRRAETAAGDAVSAAAQRQAARSRRTALPARAAGDRCGQRLAQHLDRRRQARRDLRWSRHHEGRRGRVLELPGDRAAGRDAAARRRSASSIRPCSTACRRCKPPTTRCSSSRRPSVRFIPRKSRRRGATATNSRSFNSTTRRSSDKQDQLLKPLVDQTKAATADVARKKKLLLVVDRADVIYGGTDITSDVQNELGK